jgi:hypothetical protein
MLVLSCMVVVIGLVIPVLFRDAGLAGAAE